MQYLAGSVTTVLLPQSLLADHPAKTISSPLLHQHDDDSEFVIIDGWVLLKKDLEQ